MSRPLRLEFAGALVDDSIKTQQENVERALFLYFVENNESHEDEECDPDSEAEDST